MFHLFIKFVFIYSFPSLVLNYSVHVCSLLPIIPSFMDCFIYFCSSHPQIVDKHVFFTQSNRKLLRCIMFNVLSYQSEKQGNKDCDQIFIFTTRQFSDSQHAVMSVTRQEDNFQSYETTALLEMAMFTARLLFLHNKSPHFLLIQDNTYTHIQTII